MARQYPPRGQSRGADAPPAHQLPSMQPMQAVMERAMKAVIGFDDSDAKRLEAKKAEHAKRALGGLAVFFGGSG